MSSPFSSLFEARSQQLGTAGSWMMTAQTTAQILSCNLASTPLHSPFASKLRKLRGWMFPDLSDRAYLYFSRCISGRRPRSIRTKIPGISKQHLSLGSVEYNGSRLQTLQAIYSAYWVYFSIDCFYFKMVCFFSTPLCLLVLSHLTYWWIYCCNLYWAFHSENILHLGWYGNMGL